MAIAVLDTVNCPRPNMPIKKVWTVRDTVTESLLSKPGTALTETKLLFGFAPVVSKPLLLAAAKARSWASFPLAAGIAWMDDRDKHVFCYTMRHCPEVYYMRSTDGGDT